MTILTKVELEQLIKCCPEGGIVFVEYGHGCMSYDVHITDGTFGATTLLPEQGEVFSYDWCINEYTEDDLFVVFDYKDILQMIQTLTKGLHIDLDTEDLTNMSDISEHLTTGRNKDART